MNRLISIGALALALTGIASAQFNETEPNDTYATANALANLAVGATITGNSISSTTTGIDYFRLGTAGAAPGIYRYRLVLDSATVGHSASLRGFGQTGSAAGAWDGSTVGTMNATEVSLQTAWIPAGGTQRITQWYGFGDTNAEVVYRVTGTASTTADYVATLERQAVSPVILGNFNAGSITISTIGQGHTTDTDMWVYDGDFNPILGYGNDDESVNGGGTGATLQSLLTRNYAPGTYYLALSNFHLTNEMASPNDDDFRTGQMMAFPGSILNSSATTNMNLTFSINGTQFAATKVGQTDVYFGQFTVVPEPATMAVLGLGLLPFLKRRRNKAG